MKKRKMRSLTRANKFIDLAVNGDLPLAAEHALANFAVRLLINDPNPTKAALEELRHCLVFEHITGRAAAGILCTCEHCVDYSQEMKTRETDTSAIDKEWSALEFEARVREAVTSKAGATENKESETK
jgi:hypothetical protein